MKTKQNKIYYLKTKAIKDIRTTGKMDMDLDWVLNDVTVLFIQGSE